MGFNLELEAMRNSSSGLAPMKNPSQKATSYGPLATKESLTQALVLAPPRRGGKMVGSSRRVVDRSQSGRGGGWLGVCQGGGIRRGGK